MKIFSGVTVESARILKKGGVGVIPTDTMYGIVGSARSKKTVERMYKLRERRPDKPMLILIASFADLKKFGAGVDAKTKMLLKKLWPGKVSVILPCPSKKFFYLHRGAGTLAFRLPAKRNLQNFLKKTGPLVAPSANLEGRQPATTIEEAQKYFGKDVDFYVDGGKLSDKPSTLVKFENGKVFVLRKGAADKNL